MNCEECGAPAETALCAECARENAMYARYRDAIEVPAMWDAVEWRLRARRWSRVLLAAAALIVVAILFIRRSPEAPVPANQDVVAHYRAAIQKLEPDASASALMPEINAAIARAETSARAGDPLAASRVVAAYDAKLQLLRSTYD